MLVRPISPKFIVPMSGTTPKSLRSASGTQDFFDARYVKRCSVVAPEAASLIERATKFVGRRPQKDGSQCPLWVISGHLQRKSALACLLWTGVSTSPRRC